MLISLIFAAAVASAAPAQATAPAPADDNKLVCRYEANLGTRLPVKTCKTKGQIAREAQEARDLTRTMQNSGPEKSQ